MLLDCSDGSTSPDDGAGSVRGMSIRIDVQPSTAPVKPRMTLDPSTDGFD